MLQNNVLDPNAQKGIKDLQRELQRDIESGNIYKLQENAKRYRQYEANRLAMTDPADREMYKAVTQQYIANNPEGAYGTLFEPPELQAYKDFRSMFAEDYAKQYGEDSRKEVFDKVGDKWILKNTDVVTQKLVNDRFQNWIRSKQDLPGYFKTRQKYSPTERYYDDNDNLVFDKPGYTLYDIDKAAQDLSYTQTTTGREVTQNPYKIMSIQQMYAQDNMRLKAKLEEEAAKNANNAPKPGQEWIPGIKANKLLKASADLQASMNAALQPIITDLQKVYPGVSPWKVAEKIMKEGKATHPQLYDHVANIYNSINKNYTASKDIYAQVYGVETANKIFDNIETLSNNGMSLYFGGDNELGEVSGVTYKLNNIKSIKLGPNTMKVDPSLTRIIPQNTLPIGLGFTDASGNLDPSKDFVRYVVEFTPLDADGEEQAPVYVPMYKEMSYFTNQTGR